MIKRIFLGSPGGIQEIHLFMLQVEQDLSERIDRAKEEPELIARMIARLSLFESKIRKEGTFWD